MWKFPQISWEWGCMRWPWHDISTSQEISNRQWTNTWIKPTTFPRDLQHHKRLGRSPTAQQTHGSNHPHSTTQRIMGYWLSHKENYGHCSPVEGLVVLKELPQGLQEKAKLSGQRKDWSMWTDDSIFVNTLVNNYFFNGPELDVVVPMRVVATAHSLTVMERPVRNYENDWRARIFLLLNPM